MTEDRAGPADSPTAGGRRTTTRRTVLRFAGATVAVGGLAAALPSVLGSGSGGPLSLTLAGPAPAQGFGKIGAGSVRGAVRRFDLYGGTKVVSLREVAGRLRLTGPVSLRQMNQRLYSIPTEVTLGQQVITGAALGGRVDLVLRSDGTYTSSGYMRAGGVPSFSYSLTVSVQGDGGTFLPTAVHTGTVYGWDTPGDRRRDWNESGRNENMRQGWLGIAENARLEVRRESDLAGVLGAVRDVAVKIGEFVGLAALSNPGTAALITLASALDEAVDLPLPHKDWPLGVTVAAGVIIVFGPAAIVPAIAAGGIAELAIKTRTLRDDEWDFVRKVFGDTLPPRENIILTDMLGKGNRRYVMPTVGNRFLVNLGGAAYDNPLAYTNGTYTMQGQLLIHELTHTWQGTRWPAVTYFCQGVTESGYEPGPGRLAWGDYGLEQQASIVDRWYASLVPTAADRLPAPGGDPAKVQFYDREFLPARDPDYRKKAPHMYDAFIYNNIRAGLT